MNKATPSSIAEVASLIGDARKNGQSLWFAGSGSISTPGGHTVVSTELLTGIVDYRPDDLTVVVRAGTTLGELDDILGEHRQTAVLPETAPNRTVGGVIAAGASGYRRRRYGPTRDRVIGATIVTGYGEVVHAGGQLVKNVTGYDIPRLVTGSHGALGFIAEISLKLWPDDSIPRTLSAVDPAVLGSQLYQPTAALETESGGFVYVSHVQHPPLDWSVSEGFDWPDPIDEPVVVSANVPPRLVVEAVSHVRDIGATRFIAQHGVGVVDVGWKEIDEARIVGLRKWAELCGGSLVIRRRGPLDGSLSRWGRTPGSVDIQLRLKELFDPDRVCNPGVLPGGV